MADPIAKRLPLIRVTDSVLSLLQGAFGDARFIESGEPLFVAGDPKLSKVWICDPESRVTMERDGARDVVLVERGDYVPRNMGLQQRGGGGFSQPVDFKDLADAAVFISCEAGDKLAAERLANLVYSLLRLFRARLMEDYDLHDLRVQSVSTPITLEDAPGKPWIVRVTVMVTLEEQATISEIANVLNRLAVIDGVTANGGSPVVTPTAADPAFPDR